MLSEIAIRVSNIEKRYEVFTEPHHRLLQMLLGSKRKLFREFWALKNLSFDIEKGETVGIVGRNGSGKSTLLQIICGTLNPTNGEVIANGRIAALLELGSGFNPEFTGRENVFLYASVLGLSREATQRKFEEIETFADIGDFIEQPTKTYSSGMVLRLAFSVAIHVDPEIMIIDEALAVGDELFQRKCFSKIEELKQRGVTILFVSHSGSAIIDLCDRAILLDGGELLTSGDPKTVVGLYQKLLYAPAHNRLELRRGIREGSIKPQDAQGQKNVALESPHFDPMLISKSMISYDPNGAQITNPQLTDSKGRVVNCLNQGEIYKYTYQVRFVENANNVRFGMLIKSSTGTELGGHASASSLPHAIEFIPAGQVVAVSFEFEANLNPGIYFLNAGLQGEINGEFRYLHRILDALAFRINPIAANKSTGYIDFKCNASWSSVNLSEKTINL